MSPNRDYKNIIIGVLVIIIIILCVLLFLALRGRNNISNPEVNNNDTVEKVANIPEIEEEIKSLNRYLSYLYPINNPNDLDNQKKLYFLMEYLPYAGAGFSKDEGNDVNVKFFGTNYQVKYEDIICFADNEVILKYDGARYTRVGEHGHGGRYEGMIVSKTIETSYSKTKDEYYVKALYLELGDLEGIGSIIGNEIGENTYVDFFGMDEEQLNSYKDDGYTVISADDYLESIKDTLTPITYTYKLNNGNYYLVSVK